MEPYLSSSVRDVLVQLGAEENAKITFQVVLLDTTSVETISQ